MSKKLSEYTLGEMKKICSSHKCCNNCVFCEEICDYGRPKNPEIFSFADKISFTINEIVTARELMQCFGEDAEIERNGANWYVKVGQSLYPMQPAFQSLLGQPNFTIRLEDILRNTVEL